MDNVALAGDWHGDLRWQKAALHTLGQRGDIDTILHAGDYGVGWPGGWPDFGNSAESVLKRYDMHLYVTLGNHENWDYVNSLEFDDNGYHEFSDHVTIFARNAMLNLPYSGGWRLVHSLGGAPSIDFQWRTEGKSWWKGEMITHEDVMTARSIGEMYDVDIMVTHDAPDGGTDRVQQIVDFPDFNMWTVEGLAYAAEGRALMNHAVAGVKPKVFVHGHFHAPDMKQTDETLYVSLGCNTRKQWSLYANNLAILDLETLQAEFLALDAAIADGHLT